MLSHRAPSRELPTHPRSRSFQLHKHPTCPSSPGFGVARHVPLSSLCKVELSQVSGVIPSTKLSLSRSPRKASPMYLSISRTSFLSCIENLAAIPFLCAAITQGVSKLTEFNKPNNAVKTLFKKKNIPEATEEFAACPRCWGLLAAVPSRRPGPRRSCRNCSRPALQSRFLQGWGRTGGSREQFIHLAALQSV